MVIELNIEANFPGFFFGISLCGNTFTSLIESEGRSELSKKSKMELFANIRINLNLFTTLLNYFFQIRGLSGF